MTKCDVQYNGKPLEVLNRLIAKRADVLRESAKDAVVATAIIVTQSLRAKTKVHKKDRVYVHV